MATKIKETPVLRGEDAKRFIKNTKSVKKVDKKTRKRISSDFKKLNDIAEPDIKV